MARSAWKKRARKFFSRKAVNHFGDGQFAYVTPCRRRSHYSLVAYLEGRLNQLEPLGSIEQDAVGRCNPRSSLHG